ncbi:hypothetical protein BCR34DRAFT_288083 [Clohesyomyces aquaticus]|uniref:AIG1-type G domain-containing protein n=1 Tax=Clohesyomyces aquaticus TaxID=1231657 RepID=A0A1Y1ZR29_9PLEO|nr:hypothetical protein BCR34DRAFT_288083 [Clohesyomyces aquaticus]
MDTPGFDHGVELEVFHEVAKGIEAVRPYARIVGVLLVIPMHHTRVNEMDEKLLRFTQALCGDEYISQVTIVTTFWDAHKEKQKLKYNARLSNLLEKVKELWSIQRPISHYQHGRKYEAGQDTGAFLEWDEDRDDIVDYAKDMIRRNYENISPRDPQIVQEIGIELTLEHTEAGRFLSQGPAYTPKSTSNSTSSSSTTPSPEERSREERKQENPKQEKLRQDLPNQDSPKEPHEKDLPKRDQSQPFSSSDGASRQGNGAQAQANEKGWWDYALDIFGTIVRNTHFEVSAGSSGGFSNARTGFSGGPHGPSLTHVTMGPRYNGPVDRNSVVDSFKIRGWDPSPANRMRVGQQLGVSGTPGTASYHDELRRKVEMFF